MIPVDDVSGLSLPAAYELGRRDERLIIQDKIARLQAEVERLKALMVTGEVIIQEKHVGFLSELFDRRWKESFEHIQRERNEALAEVDCLKVERDGAVKRAQMCLEHADFFKTEVAGVRDRLQRAEAVVRALEDFVADNRALIETGWGESRLRATLAIYQDKS